MAAHMQRGGTETPTRTDGSTQAPPAPVRRNQPPEADEVSKGGFWSRLSDVVEDTAEDVWEEVSDVGEGVMRTTRDFVRSIFGVDEEQEGTKTVDREAATETEITPKQGGEISDADVVTIQRGALTSMGEGSDAETSHIHRPGTEASGVTIGKGYDIGSRTPEQVIADLTAAGLPEATAREISQGAGLRGDAAQAFADAHASSVGEIPVDVQVRLLGSLLPEYTERARTTATSTTPDSQNRNAAGREAMAGAPAGTFRMTDEQWNNLHPATTELLTDLIYQGGYYGWDRVAQINQRLIANDGDQVAQLRAVRELFARPDGADSYMDQYAERIGEGRGGAGASVTFGDETVEYGGSFKRNSIRLAYLNHVIGALESGQEVRVSGR